MRKLKDGALVILSAAAIVGLGVGIFLGFMALASHLVGINPNWGAALLLLAVGLVLAGALGAVGGWRDRGLAAAAAGLSLALAHLVQLRFDDWPETAIELMSFAGILLASVFVAAVGLSLTGEPTNKSVDKAQPAESD